MVEIKQIKEISRNEWYVEHLDACPFFAEPSAHGFTMPFPKFPYYYGFVAAYYSNKQLDWATLIKDQKAIGGRIIEAEKEKKGFFLALYKEWSRNFREFYGFGLKIKKTDFSSLKDNEFINLFEQYYKKLLDMPFPGFIDAFMFYGDKAFPEMVESFCKKNKIKDYQKIQVVLSAPVESSFFYEKENELHKISGLKDKKNAIDNYIDRFFWIKGSYAGAKEYDYKDAFEELYKFIKEDKRPVPIYLQNKKTKSELIARCKFTPEIISFMKLIELLSKWQDERKVYTLLHISLDGRFLEEFSNRLKIDIALLKYSFSDELIKSFKSLDKKSFEKTLAERKKGSLWIYSKGKPEKIILGKEAEEIFDKIQHKETAEIKEIKGIPASLGNASGRVVIIKCIDDLKKVKQGDILVTGMTRPEHTIALKKAKAIITDDGGITCHAAIVSRELKIPCIIGTKIATKVLKDGDYVEVDADKGIARILSGYFFIAL